MAAHSRRQADESDTCWTRCLRMKDWDWCSSEFMAGTLIELAPFMNDRFTTRGPKDQPPISRVETWFHHVGMARRT